jgi:hypothetical protein
MYSQSRLTTASLLVSSLLVGTFSGSSHCKGCRRLKTSSNQLCIITKVVLTMIDCFEPFAFWIHVGSNADFGNSSLVLFRRSRPLHRPSVPISTVEPRRSMPLKEPDGTPLLLRRGANAIASPYGLSSPAIHMSLSEPAGTHSMHFAPTKRPLEASMPAANSLSEATRLVMVTAMVSGGRG